jgi:hydroxymethylbilane synthase
MLAALDGSCRTPIAGLATLDGDRLTLDGLLLKPDGGGAIAARLAGPIGDAERIGSAVGAELRRRAGAEYGFA